MTLWKSPDHPGSAKKTKTFHTVLAREGFKTVQTVEPNKLSQILHTSIVRKNFFVVLAIFIHHFVVYRLFMKMYYDE